MGRGPFYFFLCIFAFVGWREAYDATLTWAATRQLFEKGHFLGRCGALWRLSIKLADEWTVSTACIICHCEYLSFIHRSREDGHV